mmetsp:Transcript_130820/g.279867  ORF Transcript_130820/g.279867 Transcript_130820/m.279867 type:complete len:289 (-) Transcript_130820:4-870(-)
MQSSGVSITFGDVGTAGLTFSGSSVLFPQIRRRRVPAGTLAVALLQEIRRRFIGGVISIVSDAVETSRSLLTPDSMSISSAYLLGDVGSLSHALGEIAGLSRIPGEVAGQHVLGEVVGVSHILGDVQSRSHALGEVAGLSHILREVAGLSDILGEIARLSLALGEVASLSRTLGEVASLLSASSLSDPWTSKAIARSFSCSATQRAWLLTRTLSNTRLGATVTVANAALPVALTRSSMRSARMPGSAGIDLSVSALSPSVLPETDNSSSESQEITKCWGVGAMVQAPT